MNRWMVLASAFVTLSACGEVTAPMVGDPHAAAMEGEGEKHQANCSEAWRAYDICRDRAQIACEEAAGALEACVDAHGGGGAWASPPSTDPWDDVVGPEEDHLPEACVDLGAEVMACRMACLDEYFAKEEACLMGPDSPGQPGQPEEPEGSGQGHGGAPGWEWGGSDDPPPPPCDTLGDECPPSDEGGSTGSDD